MPIYKSKDCEKFTTIPNATVQNVELSFEARGVLAHILSLPDNWEIHKTWLLKQSPNCGRDKLNRIFSELKEKGYIAKKQRRSECGKTADGWDWYVYAYPVTAGDTAEKPKLEKSRSPVERETRTTENQSDADTATTNKQTKQINKPTNKPAREEFSQDVRDEVDTVVLFKPGYPKDIPEPSVEFIDRKVARLYAKYSDPCPVSAAEIIVKDWMRLQA